MGSLIFGKYKIQRRLAVGGMGEVFLAHDGVGKPVILKALLPELASQPDFVRQFFDEAKLVARLSHPNIVGVFEVGTWDGTHYMVMEYIAGRTVAELIDRSAELRLTIPDAVVARIAVGVATGLHHAHLATDEQGRVMGIVHRDISPQNVMISEQGSVRVLDFGVARGTHQQTKTSTGMLKGKLNYMAPEYLARGEATPHIDQWSLGVVLWELVTRRRLFKSNDATPVGRGPVPTPSEAGASCSPALAAAVMRMLSPDPSARFASCAAVADEFEMMACSPPVAQAFFSKLGAPNRVSPVLTPDFVSPLSNEIPRTVVVSPSSPVPAQPDTEMSGLHMSGLVKALKAAGLFDGVLAAVRPDARVALIDPYSAKWFPSRIGYEVLSAIIRVNGTAVYEDLNLRMSRDSLGVVMLPMVKVAMAIGGKSPNILLNRLDGIVQMTNRGVRLEWKNSNPTAGVLKLTYVCDTPSELVEYTWRGILRFGEDLTARQIRVERFETLSPRLFAFHLSW